MSKNYVRADSQVYNSNETNGNVRKLADCIDTTTNEVKVTFAGSEPGGHGLATSANQETVINASLRDINTTGAIGDGSSQHSAMCLGYDRSNGQGRSLLVDANGTLETNVTMNTGHGLATEAKQDDIINATNRAINNTGSIGDGSTNATVVALGYDRTNGKGVSLLVDSGGRLDVNCLGNTVGDGSGDVKSLHLDGTGNVQTNVVNTVNVSPANSVNSGITNDPANSVAVGMRGRTDIADAASETFLLTDANGHLQVDVLSGAGSSDATAANQSTMITKLGEIDTAVDLSNSKLDTIEATLTNIETDAAALEVLNTTISNQQLLQTSTLALHQTGGTNTTFTIADGGNSVSKAVSLSDIRVAQLTPEVIGYKITSTGTAGSGTDIDMEISFDGTNFTQVFSNIASSSKSKC